MPLPTPHPRESQSAFISRCMSALKDDFPDPQQRLAICYAQYRKPKRSKRLHSEGTFTKQE